MRDGANVPDESSVSLMGAELGAACPEPNTRFKLFAPWSRGKRIESIK